jgi:hypothetical protein
MRKIIFLLLLLISYNIKVFSQTPLILDIDIGNEIWLEGQIVIFNGWPPNIRMIVMENYIIGIEEKDIPKELKEYLPYDPPKGKFKLKFIRKTRLPYYEAELLVFKIIEYKDMRIDRIK